MNMLAVFGIGTTELLILAAIAGMVCLPVVIAIVVVVILTTQNRRRE